MKILQERAGRNFGFTLIELMIVIAIIAILAAILVPNFVKSRAQAHLTACKSNVKNIGTACEMYATNNEGRYPSSLSSLTVGSTGGYLKIIPSCPSAGSDTYTAWYTCATNPDAFTVRCGGANHLAVDVSAGYPMYDSTVGLICYGDEVAMGGGSGGSGVPGPEEVINNLNGGGGSGGSGSSGGDSGGTGSGSGGGTQGGGGGAQGGEYWSNEATVDNYKHIQTELLRKHKYLNAMYTGQHPGVPDEDWNVMVAQVEADLDAALQEANDKFGKYGVSFSKNDMKGYYLGDDGKPVYILTFEEYMAIIDGDIGQGGQGY